MRKCVAKKVMSLYIYNQPFIEEITRTLQKTCKRHTTTNFKIKSQRGSWNNIKQVWTCRN